MGYRKRSPLSFESLELRRLLTTFTVTNLADAGSGSLRAAVDMSNVSPGVDTIVFDSSLGGQTIGLTGGEIAIRQSVTIDATALSAGVTIDAAGSDLTPNVADGQGSRIFNIDDGDVLMETVVEMRGLELTGGDVAGDGGAVWTTDSLVLHDSRIADSHATGSGGAIASRTQSAHPWPESLLTLTNAELSGNSGRRGGAVYWDGLDGAVIHQSTVSDNWAIETGGGLQLVFANLNTLGGGEIRDSVISGNQSQTGGGGLHFSHVLDGGEFAIYDSEIRDNTSYGDGGGIFGAQPYARVNVHDSVVSGNTAHGVGGGVFLDESLYSIATISGSTIRHNSAVHGGGILTTFTTVITESQIRDNVASQDGGGLAFWTNGYGGDDNTLSLRHSTIAGNSAQNGGGISVPSMNGSTLQLDASTVSGNHAAGSGGGIDVNAYGGNLQIRQATISGNTSDNDAAGVRAYQVSDVSYASVFTHITIEMSTIVGNRAHQSGGGSGSGFTGGILIEGDGTEMTDSVQIRNSIVHNNGTASGQTDLSIALGISRIVESNLIGVANTNVFPTGTGNNLIGVNPMLASLASNGGHVQTHALLPNSPAIDFNDGSQIANLPSYDARGYARVVDGDGDGSAEIDLGSYELQTGIDGDFNDDGIYDCADIDYLTSVIANATHPPAADLTGDGIVDTNDRDAWLAEAGEANLGPGKAYRLGDANLSGSVDASDYNIWNSHRFSLDAVWCNGDFSTDGSIDVSDLILWNQNRFTFSGSPPSRDVAHATIADLRSNDCDDFAAVWATDRDSHPTFFLPSMAWQNDLPKNRIDSETRSRRPRGPDPDRAPVGNIDLQMQRVFVDW